MKGLQIKNLFFMFLVFALTAPSIFATSLTKQKKYNFDGVKAVHLYDVSQSFVSMPQPISSEQDSCPIEIEDEDKDEDGKKETEYNSHFVISHVLFFSSLSELIFISQHQNTHFGFVNKTPLFIANRLLRI